jgi:uncharacterized protein YegP (UPF0339 family)
MITIKIYKSGIIRRDWKWRAVAANGKIIASGRGFNSKALALDSIDLLVKSIRSGSYSIEQS